MTTLSNSSADTPGSEANRPHGAPTRAPDFETLRMMVDSLPSPILVLDTSRRVVVSNAAWQRQRPDAPTVDGRVFEAVAMEFSDDVADVARLSSLVSKALSGDSSEHILLHTADAAGPRWWQVSAQLAEQAQLVTLVHEEVTALVRTQWEQRAQQTVLEHAQHIARMGHWEFSQETRRARASAQALEILGVGPEVLDSFEKLLDLIPDGEREAVREGIRAARSGEVGRTIRHRIIRPDGAVRWVEHTFDALPDSRGTGSTLMGVIHDITEQVASVEALRINREALRESNTRQHEALRIARAALWRLDMATGRVSWSPEARDIFGDDLAGTAAELVGRRHPDDRARVARTFRGHDHDAEPFSLRYRVRNAEDTDWRWVENRVVPEISEDHVLVGYRGIVQDIDDQVQREVAIQESADRERAALRIARAAVWTWDRRTRAIWQSPDLYELLGFETMSEDFEARVNQRHPADRETSMAQVNEAIRQRLPFTVRYRLARPDGSWVWIEERGVPNFDAGGELTGYRGTRQDVDEQVQREEALRERDEGMREALRIARAGIWTWDRKTDRMTMQSDDLFAFYGHDASPDSLSGLLAMIHPDDVGRATATSQDAMRKRIPYSVRCRLVRADGSYGWIEARGEPTFSPDGEYLGYRGTRQDVDEQVRREEVLRERDSHLREALRIARAGMWTWDLQTGLVEQSPEFYQRFGYDSTGATREDHIALRHPDDRERTRRESREAVEARRAYTIRYRLARKDGSYVWIESNAVPQFDEHGRLVAYRGTSQDVDEQVRREEALRESDEGMREALRIARAANWSWDRSTKTLWQSPELYRLLGYESVPDTFDGRVSLRHPEDQQRSRDAAEQAMRERRPFVVRYRIARPDGGWAWIEQRGTPQFDSAGEYVGYRGTRQDVDEQVRREEDLREALKVARAGFWYLGRHDRTAWWSPELYEMIGMTPEEMPPDGAIERHPDDQQRFDQITREAVRAHQPYTVRYRVRHHATGEWLWTELRGVPVLSIDGKAVAYRGVIRDISEEMERQAELQRSQALLEQAQRLSRVGSFAINLASGEQRWSAEQFRLLGYEPREVPAGATAFFDRVHPDDLAFVKDAFRALIEDGTPIAREYRVMLPSGEVRYLDGAAELRRDPDGRPAEIVGATHDVTERIRSEARIRQSEARLRGVLDSVGDGITLITRRNRNDWTNAAFRRMVGYTEEELAAVGPRAVFDEATTRDTVEWWQGIGRGGSGRLPRTYRMRLRRKDGSYITAECTPSILKDGDEVMGLLSVVRDTTERDRLQAQVDAATEETQQILQTAPLPIFVLEADGAIAMANDSTAQVFGWEAGHLVGQPVAALSTGLTPQALIVAGQAASRRDDEHVTSVEVVCRRYDGSEFPAQVAMTELHTSDGGSRYLCVLIDLTERKQAEEELTRMQKAEALGTLVAGVAHDFNNLLTAMVGGIAMAQSDPADPHWLSIAQEAAGRATRLVQQLLQFSRRSRPESQAIDPVELVERTSALVRETIDRRVAIEVALEPFEGVVAGDEGQLEQVVMNLVLNARDALVQRAESAGADYRPAINISVRADRLRGRPAVRIAVSDNGVGMTPAVRARAFDPFFTTKAVGTGTGLGLATVAGIIERHDGDITTESAVGVGTTIAVRLPLVAAEESHAAASPPLGTDTTPVRHSALVIDDEDMVRAVSVAYLERAHYDVISVKDGEEAIRILEAGTPVDIVLTDINMPSPNGWEILARLGGKPGMPPIVVVSGYAEADLARERGAAAFLHKPFTMDALLTTFREILAPE